MSKVSAAARRGAARGRFNLLSAQIEEFKREQAEERRVQRRLGKGRLLGGGIGGLLGVIALGVATGGTSTLLQTIAALGSTAVATAAGVGAGVGSFAGQKQAIRGGRGKVGVGKFYQEQGRQRNRFIQSSIGANAIRDATTAAQMAFLSKSIISQFGRGTQVAGAVSGEGAIRVGGSTGTVGLQNEAAINNPGLFVSNPVSSFQGAAGASIPSVVPPPAQQAASVAPVGPPVAPAGPQFPNMDFTQFLGGGVQDSTFPYSTPRIGR